MPKQIVSNVQGKPFPGISKYSVTAKKKFTEYTSAIP